MTLGSSTLLGQTTPGNGAGEPAQGGPVIVGERDELQTFRIYNVRGGIDLLSIWRDQKVRPAEGDRLRSTELEFRETMDLSAQGSVLHSNFLHLDLFGRFGAQQTRTTLSGFDPGPDSAGEGWSFDYLLEHDAAATFMRNSRAPLTLYSRRSQTILHRPFGDSLDSITTEHGARLSFVSVPIPTDLAFFRREQETSLRRGITDFSIQQDSFLWDSHFTPADNQFVTWSYTFDEVRQKGDFRDTTAFRRHTALLSHSLGFGADEQHHLQSTLSFFHEDGERELTRIRWNELLRLQHTSRFETRYEYTLDYTTRPDVDQLLHRGTAGFRHRLFESVTSVGTVGASRLTLSDGNANGEGGHLFTSDTIFGDLELQYDKKVPHGRLSAQTGISYSRQDESERNGTIQVLREPHTFSPAGIIAIHRRNIVPASIVVRDVDGIFTYQPGHDYTVQSFIDRVEIRRVLGGDILDGQTVLIDYQMQVEPANVTTTLGWRIAARYDIEEGWLEGLGLYGRYAQQDQSRRNDVAILLPANDVRDLTIGADYRIGYLTLLAERQWHDSTISPFRATRLEGRYNHPLSRRSTVLLTGTYTDIDRYEDEITTQIIALSGRWNQEINERLRVGLELQWRDERDRPGVHVQGFEQLLDFSWRYRQTSFYGMARNAFLQSDARDSTFQTIQLGVRREF